MSKLKQAVVCGPAGQAHWAEPRRVGQSRIDLPHIRCLGDRIVLPASRQENLLAGIESGVVARYDFADRMSRHHLPKLDRRHVGLSVIHPSAHVRIK